MAEHAFSWRRSAIPILMLGFVAVVSLARGLRFEFDFHHFYLDARYVWQHAALNPDERSDDPMARRQLPFYLPSVSVLLAPLAAGGPTIAAILWTTLQVLSLVVAIVLLARWPTNGRASTTISAALLLASPALFEAAKFNQLTIPILALVLAGQRAVERAHPCRAGVWLAVAALFKLLPGVFLLWLVRQHRWMASASMLIALALLTILPALLLFGFPQALADHEQWWTHNVNGSAARGLTDPTLRAHFTDHRNQSFAAVLARCCWPEHPHPAPVRLGSLSLAACTRVAQLTTGAFLLLALWLARRTASASRRAGNSGDTRRLRIDFATLLLVMLIVSPLIRTYYLLWALPALVLLCDAARCTATKRLGYAGITIWLLGMLAWMSVTARTYGVHPWMLLGMVIVLWGMRRAADASSKPAEHDAGVVPAEAE